jgi:stage V sporulation protein SpoVS
MPPPKSYSVGVLLRAIGAGALALASKAVALTKGAGGASGAMKAVGGLVGTGAAVAAMVDRDKDQV